MATPSGGTGDRDGRPLGRVRALAAAGAAAAAVAVWAVGEPLLGHDLVVQQPGRPAQDLGFAAIAVFVLVPSLLGWALLALLERVTRHAGRAWAAIALTVLAVSFAPVISVEASGGSKIVLALAHAAVGVVLIPVLWRTAQARRRRSDAAGR